MKANSGQAPSTLIPEYLGSDFDKVASVADNLEYVKQVAEAIAGLPVKSYAGPTPPTHPVMGSEWYCTTDGRTYIWYEDGDSSQWVESSPQSTNDGLLQDLDTILDPKYKQITEALRRSYAEAGYTLVSGSFEKGGTLTSATDVLLYEKIGKAYSNTGPYPVTVAAGTLPTALSGYVPRTEVVLRGELESGGVSIAEFAKIGAFDSTGTIAELASGKWPVGTRVRVSDRAYGVFLVSLGGTANGYTKLSAGAGLTALLQHNGTIDVNWCGADKTGAVSSTAPVKAAVEYIGTGVIYAPRGNYRYDGKLSFNESGLKFKGDGPDLTYSLFYENPLDNYKTGIEVNNGSWNDISGVYATSGASIGSTAIEGMSVVSVNKTGATGVVFARATKGCYLDSVKIVGWAVPARFYGAWYAHCDNFTFESNVGGVRIGYETNNFSFNTGDFTSNDNYHVEFESSGTCRAVAFNNTSFDGLPSLFGVYAKNVSGLSFNGATYMEIYQADNKTAPMVQCGANVINAGFSSIDLIFPGDNSYAGKAITLGAGAGVGAIGVSFKDFRQYNSGSGTSIDCSYAREVEFGENVRTSSPIVGTIGQEILPSEQSVANLQSTTGTDEIKALVFITKRPTDSPINLSYMMSANASFAGQKLRIVRADTNDVLIEHSMGTEVAGTVVNIGQVSGMISGVPLVAWTYKVGSSISWPAMSVIAQSM